MKNEVEIWKRIEGFSNYQISNYGLIRNIMTDRILKPNTHKTGSLRIRLSQNNRRYTFLINRLVYKTFIGCLQVGLDIDHRDNDRSNNYYKNLQQITHRMNCSKDKWRNVNKDSKFVGVRKSGSKLNPWRAQIRINGKLKHLGSYASEKEAHKAYNIELNLLENVSKLEKERI